MESQLWATIGAYALTGAIISAVIQATKSWIDSRGARVVWSLAISFFLGSIAYAAQFIPGSWITVIAGIFASANTVYVLFFKGNEK